MANGAPSAMSSDLTGTGRSSARAKRTVLGMGMGALLSRAAGQLPAPDRRVPVQPEDDDRGVHGPVAGLVRVVLAPVTGVAGCVVRVLREDLVGAVVLAIRLVAV